MKFKDTIIFLPTNQHTLTTDVSFASYAHKQPDWRSVKSLKTHHKFNNWIFVFLRVYMAVFCRHKIFMFIAQLKCPICNEVFRFIGFTDIAVHTQHSIYMSHTLQPLRNVKSRYTKKELHPPRVYTVCLCVYFPAKHIKCVNRYKSDSVLQEQCKIF